MSITPLPGAFAPQDSVLFQVGGDVEGVCAIADLLSPASTDSSICLNHSSLCNTSKYNPIEHRLFPHLTRVCQGVIFESVDMVKELMAKAKTQTGLKVFTSILDGVYEIGRKVSQEFKQTMEIVFDDDLPQWNYTAKPQ